MDRVTVSPIALTATTIRRRRMNARLPFVVVLFCSPQFPTRSAARREVSGKPGVHFHDKRRCFKRGIFAQVAKSVFSFCNCICITYYL
jgi:hypothetical protein